MAYMISGVLASIPACCLAARLGRGDIASGTNLLPTLSPLADRLAFSVPPSQMLRHVHGALLSASCLQGLTIDECALLTPGFLSRTGAIIALFSPLAFGPAKAGVISKTNVLTEEKA